MMNDLIAYIFSIIFFVFLIVFPVLISISTVNYYWLWLLVIPFFMPLPDYITTKTKVRNAISSGDLDNEIMASVARTLKQRNNNIIH